MRDFGIKLKHGFGEDQVKIHSPIDKERKQAVFLPASALMMTVSSCDVPSNSKPLPHHVKNRRTSSIILNNKPMIQ
jgi:hypothetical protein